MVNGQLRGVYKHAIVLDPSQPEYYEHHARFNRITPPDGRVSLPVYKAVYYDAIAAFLMNPSNLLAKNNIVALILFLGIMFLANVPFCKEGKTGPYFVIGKLSNCKDSLLFMQAVLIEGTV